MADGKRYYWLRLHDDFFDSKRIKKLRKMAGGDTYTIIYLKMQLLAMKTDGVIKWTGLEENVAEELALDLDEEVDDVKVTLTFLLHCGLAETSDNINFFFPYAITNTGSETASAQRVREHREKQKALQCNKSVTESNSKSNSKRKEKELEVEVVPETDCDCDSKLQTLGGDIGQGVVNLTDEQMNDLLNRLGLDMFNYYCKRLADYIIEKDAHIKSHYNTILKWYKEDSKCQSI